MAKRFEGFFKPNRKTELYYQVWEPDEQSPQCNLIVAHGFGEHSGYYSHYIDGMKDLPVRVIALDHQGHGRSTGKRGYIPQFNDYVFDFTDFYKQIVQDFAQTKKNVIFGHSMGGLIVTKTVLLGRELNYDVLALSSPCFGLSTEVPKIKDLAARVFAKYLPTLTLAGELEYDDLTKDPVFLARYPKDPLRHDKASLGLYLGMLEGFEYVRENIHRLKSPVSFQVSGDDVIVDSLASQELFQKVESEHKQLKVYNDLKHEIFNEVGRDQVFADLQMFLKEFL